MDKEFDNRVEQNMKRLAHMKKYRSRYKSLLVGVDLNVLMNSI